MLIGEKQTILISLVERIKALPALSPTWAMMSSKVSILNTMVTGYITRIKVILIASAKFQF